MLRNTIRNVRPVSSAPLWYSQISPFASSAPSIPRPSSPSTPQPVEVLNFQDSKTAYASKSISELVRARMVLKLCSVNFIVDNNEKLMKFGRMILKFGLFDKLMKMTFYGQFVGGTDVDDLRPALMKMQGYGVRPILDYSVEADLSQDDQENSEDVAKQRDQSRHKEFRPDVISGNRKKFSPIARSYPYLGEESCEANLKIFLECLETASQVCDTQSFSAIKVTALSKPNALLANSDLLVQVRELYEANSVEEFDNLPDYIHLNFLPKDVLGPKSLLVNRRMYYSNFEALLKNVNAEIDESEMKRLFEGMLLDNEDSVHFFKFRSLCLPGGPLYTILTKKAVDGVEVLTPLSESNIQAMYRLQERLQTLAQKAVELNSKLLIDAEQTYFQPLIDFYANWLMAEYNKDEAYIFNTYQCYLKGTPSQLIWDTNKAQKLGYKIGCKLVRGAYMEQERQRALELDYDDPIYPNKALTNSCYHNMTEILLPLVRAEEASVMIASHNEFSIQYVVERMRQCDIHPQTGGIYFGQLLGMCDQVTYLLGSGGYCSYKYVPYGPVEAVLPYLSRRALENKGMLQGSQKEIDLLKTELWRRKFGFTRL